VTLGDTLMLGRLEGKAEGPLEGALDGQVLCVMLGAEEGELLGTNNGELKGGTEAACLANAMAKNLEISWGLS